MLRGKPYTKHAWVSHKCIQGSRHTVVCQRPRKPRGTQVCYLSEPPLAPFQPIVT